MPPLRAAMQSPAPPSAARPLLLVLLGFLAFYAANAAPGITWEDSATYHRLLSADGPLWGSAVSHRLYFAAAGTILALPLPGDPAWKLNLLNAILSTGCLGLVFLVTRGICGRNAAGFLAVASLGVSHLFWHYAEVTKAYPFMNLLWLASFWGLLRGTPLSRAASGLCQGLSLGVHPYAAAFLPAAAVFLALTRPRGRALAAWLAGWSAGLAGVGLLYADLIREKGAWDFLGHWASAGQGELVTGMSQGHELITISWKRLPLDALEWLAYLVYQFPLTLPLAAFGMPFCLRRHPAAGWALLAFYAATVAVPFDFNVPLKINFYFPGFVVAAVWIGAGLEPFLTRKGGASRKGLLRAKRAWLAAALLAPPLLYAAVALSPLRERLPSSLRKPADAPYKDRVRFYLWPPKRGFDEPRFYAERAFRTVEPDAVVIADFQERDVLIFHRDRMGRPDVTVHHLSAWGGEEGLTVEENFRVWARRAAGDRPLYVGHAYRPLWTGSGWRSEPAGDFDKIDLPAEPGLRR